MKNLLCAIYIFRSIKDDAGSEGDVPGQPAHEVDDPFRNQDISEAREEERSLLAQADPDRSQRSSIRDGSVRIRLNDAADNVEIEFIDENQTSSI